MNNSIAAREELLPQDTTPLLNSSYASGEVCYAQCEYCSPSMKYFYRSNGEAAPVSPNKWKVTLGGNIDTSCRRPGCEC
jgi:hypothetical protein